MKVSDDHLEELTHDETFLCPYEAAAMARELIAARKVIEQARKHRDPGPPPFDPPDRRDFFGCVDGHISPLKQRDEFCDPWAEYRDKRDGTYLDAALAAYNEATR